MTAERYRTQDVIDAIMDARGILSVAARALGCDRETVVNYAKRHVTVRDAITSARESMTDLTEGKLYQAINKGEPWAIALYLRTVGRERGYIEQRDLKLSGDTDAPLKFTIRITDASDGD